MKAPKCMLLFWVLLSFIFSINIQAQNISVQTHEWWTSDHLHLFITQEGQLPSPSNNQAKYFLSFKNKWTLEAEGLINHKLKNNQLIIESITAGESNFDGKHTLGIHVIMKQVSESKRHRSCNFMAYIFTGKDDINSLEKKCNEKLNSELKSFKKDWKVLGFFRGDVKNAQHRIHWEGVVGVK